jgi:hypothetical protein
MTDSMKILTNFVLLSIYKTFKLCVAAILRFRTEPFNKARAGRLCSMAPTLELAMMTSISESTSIMVGVSCACISEYMGAGQGLNLFQTCYTFYVNYVTYTKYLNCIS